MRRPAVQHPDIDLPPARVRLPAWAAMLGALICLYVFISSINLMGHGLNYAARHDPAAAARIRDAFQFADNPLAGLCIGLLLTSAVQSSSFTTSFTVGLVAAGTLSLASAVPIIMGANIGTSITSTLVSLAHLRRREEFRRALAGATLHDIFNILSVLVLFPLQWRYRLLSRAADAAADLLVDHQLVTPDPGRFNLVKFAVAPFTRSAEYLFADLLRLPPAWVGGLTAILAVVLLFASLSLLVRALKGAIMNRLGDVFERVLFARGWRSFLVGIVATVMVQSSSVTTSLAVPLVGSGVLQLRQVYPYMLGANLGTTITAMLAALSAAALVETPAAAVLAAAGIATALAHLLFNVLGTAIFWPLRRIPMAIAVAWADLASRRRVLVFIALLLIFFLVPLIIIIMVNWLRITGGPGA